MADAPADKPALIQAIDRQECLQLLGYGSYVGHLGFTDGDRQLVLPVNYLFEHDYIYIRTAKETLLSGLGGKAVAFQVDNHQPLERAGWSVLVNGSVELVDDADQVDALRRGPLRSWAWRSADQWLRISVDTISGRRIGEAV
jgi:uncharacterized protein